MLLRSPFGAYKGLGALFGRCKRYRLISSYPVIASLAGRTVGNLGQALELKQTQSGTSVTNFTIATNEVWKGQDGERKERTEWHRIVVWGKQAEHCAQYLEKGRSVHIEGRLQTREWETKEGEKRYTTEIVADRVTFLGSKSDGGSRPQPPPHVDRDMPF